MNHKLELKNGIFYSCSEAPCPYLDNRLEKKIITELSGKNAVETYNHLSRCGFRRSNKLCYTQICSTCSQCIPIRVDVNNFIMNRSFKRVLSKNQNISYLIKEARADFEQFEIFKKYQKNRHKDGDMLKMDFEEYRLTIEESPVDTKIFEFRNHQNQFYALSICDFLDDGLSAVYLFFDTDFSATSPGNFTILSMIAETQKRGLKYLYLGFWIPESQKMAYKSKFKCAEILTHKGWQPLENIVNF